MNPTTNVPHTINDESRVSFLPMEAVNDSDGGFDIHERVFGEVSKGYTRFAEGDFVCAKITPCMQNGKATVVEGLISGVGFGSTEFHVLRPKDKEVLPIFLFFTFTLPSYLESAPASFTGTAGQQRLPESFLRNFPLPLPPLPVQREMVKKMEQARESRRRKLHEAEALLSGLDAFLLDRLGLTMPKPDNRLAYALRLSTVSKSKQIGADYFHPERMNALQAIHTAKNLKAAKRLEDIADFLRDISTDYEPERYLGLAGVQSQTGELAETSEEPGKGQAFIYKKNDVLFARLRPYLNKVWRAEREGVCSTEFHVIRIKKDVSQLLPDYLAAVLRSSVIVAQTKHMMTGNTHPRLANEDVVDLFIPIPDETIQRDIVQELGKRRLKARRLREEAAKEWDAAKARFETELLGTEAKP